MTPDPLGLTPEQRAQSDARIRWPLGDGGRVVVCPLCRVIDGTHTKSCLASLRVEFAWKRWAVRK